MGQTCLRGIFTSRDTCANKCNNNYNAELNQDTLTTYTNACEQWKECEATYNAMLHEVVRSNLTREEIARRIKPLISRLILARKVVIDMHERDTQRFARS